MVDGSKFTLADNTELEISEFLIDKSKKNGVFHITQGKIRATVVKLTGQATNLRVKTPTAVAGIKGTEFLMLSKGLANVFFLAMKIQSILLVTTLQKRLSYLIRWFRIRED